MRLRAPLAAVLIAPVIAVFVPMSAASAAVSITKAELQGTQLRVEGSGAQANHAITVSPGGVSGTSDAKGQFKIQVASYSSPTCQITVSDGTSSMPATLAGCKPVTTPPPTPPPTQPTPPPTTPPATGGPSFTPAVLTFPAEKTGVTSAPLTATFTNSSKSSVFINGVSTAGDDLDFTRVQDNCIGLPIAAGASCTLVITFTPTGDGTRTATFSLLDDAANSPQVLTVTGTGAGTGTGPTPLVINTNGYGCTATSCDLGAGDSFIVGNFYASLFSVTGGTEPYTWSAPGGLPTGLTLASNSLLSGTMPTLGTFGFTLKVTDSLGASTTVRFTYTVGPPPAGGATGGCQNGGVLKESLSGAAIGGRTPQGQAQADETRISTCGGGYTVITASVSNVNLPNGTVLWVDWGSRPIGLITLTNGSGSMKPYDTPQALRFDSVAVLRDPPPASFSELTLLSGGSFS